MTTENTALVDTIAQALATGLKHPGNPQNNEPPAMLHLPMFTTIGMPPQLAQTVKDTTTKIAEAIIYLIETTHTITPNTPANTEPAQ